MGVKGKDELPLATVLKGLRPEKPGGCDDGELSGGGCSRFGGGGTCSVWLW